ncbi:MAG: RecX family transcriptional regulator, partial [Myxococcales bacterium]|nr:RecX family transcriptional regulator [Myxococcales bacterium]
KMRQRGLPADLIDAALEAADAEVEDPDLAAAARYARRRRLGPFRPAEARAERREKDLAALGRAGFSYAIARRVIDAEDAAALTT